MIEVLDVVGWRLGEIEVEAVMLGQLMSEVLPNVVGLILVKISEKIERSYIDV